MIIPIDKTRENIEKELYYLITQFLSAGPCKKSARLLKEELEQKQLIPCRVDWQGKKHPCTFTQFEQVLGRVLAPDHLLQLCLRLPPLVDREVPSNISGVATLLGVGCHSVLRRKEDVGKSLCVSQKLVVRKFGHPLLPSTHARPHYPTNICSTLKAREYSGGVTSPLCHTVPTQHYSKQQRFRRLLGHLSSVYCVLFDRSGHYIFTGADDNLVKIWSARDGRLLATLRGHSGEISDIAVNFENTVLASGSCDKMIRVWCLRSLAPIAILTSHTGMVTSVRFCPYPEGDPRYLISTGNDGCVCFWSYSPRTNTFNPKPLKFIERTRPGAQMVCSSFSSGGVFLATGSTDHHIRVYHILGANGPEKILDVETHTDRVDSLIFSNLSSRFISGSKDGTALIWCYERRQWTNIVLKMATRLVNGHPVYTSEDAKLKLRVNMVFWNTDDSLVATSASNHAIKIWNSYTGTLLSVLLAHDDEVYCLETHPLDPRILLSGGHDGRICVWDLTTGTAIKNYFNMIEGQGHGAIFDCKFSPDGLLFVSTDSYGHLSIYGYGCNEPYKKVPDEVFFHTDYRPLIRDSNNHVLDEQTQCAPHLMPPAFLVDIDGNPYPPSIQRLVPGREGCADAQLVPYVASVAPGGASEVLEPVRVPTIDDMIERLQFEQAGARPLPASRRREGDVEGVRRQSTGFWQTRGGLGGCPRRSAAPVVRPLGSTQLKISVQHRLNLAHSEVDHYVREMKLPPDPRQTLPSLRKEERSLRRRSLHEKRIKKDIQEAKIAAAANEEDSSSTSLDSQEEESFSSDDSDYSDWTAEQQLPPRPSRARRLQSAPSTSTAEARDDSTQRTRSTRRTGMMNSSAPISEPGPSTSSATAAMATEPQPGPSSRESRYTHWLTEVFPKKSPYVPQVGDEVVYFWQGHQQYVQAVRKAKLYDISLRSLPWKKKNHLRAHEVAKILDVRFESLPPVKLCCVKLVLVNPCDEDCDTFSLRFHDMADVIDFIVLKQVYDQAIDRNWAPGDRFRSVIDEAWWLGTIDSRIPLNPDIPVSMFQCFNVTWDNGETEKMSPWDFELVDEDRYRRVQAPLGLPPSKGGSVELTQEEREALMYVPKNSEWSMYGQRADCRRIAAGLEKIMQLSIAEPFSVPVDVSVYPDYASVVEYSMDLNTIKSRLENRYYRRLEAIKFDIRFIETNALKFNQPNSAIVYKAKQVVNLVLSFIGRVDCDDPMVLYQSRQLSDDEEDTEVDTGPEDNDHPTLRSSRRLHRSMATNGAAVENESQYTSNSWKRQCLDLLARIFDCEDSTPFRRPVDMQAYPNYREIIDCPMDLSTIQCKLESDVYPSPIQFCKDVRLVFANSKSYNTNKKSRIYHMTLRLSTMFEELIRSIVSDWRSAVKYEEKLRNNQYVSDRRKPRGEISSYDLSQPGPSNVGQSSRRPERGKRKQESSEDSEGLSEEPTNHISKKARQDYQGFQGRNGTNSSKNKPNSKMPYSTRNLLKKSSMHLDNQSDSSSHHTRLRRRRHQSPDDDNSLSLGKSWPSRRLQQLSGEEDGCRGNTKVRRSQRIARLSEDEEEEPPRVRRTRRRKSSHHMNEEQPIHRTSTRLRQMRQSEDEEDAPVVASNLRTSRRQVSHHSEDEDMPLTRLHQSQQPSEDEGNRCHRSKRYQRHLSEENHTSRRRTRHLNEESQNSKHRLRQRQPTHSEEEANTSAKRKAFLRSKNKLLARIYDVRSSESESSLTDEDEKLVRYATRNKPKLRTGPKRKPKVTHTEYVPSDDSGENLPPPPKASKRSRCKDLDMDEESRDIPEKHNYSFRVNRHGHQTKYKLRKFKIEMESEMEEEEINTPSTSSRHHYHFRSCRAAGYLQKSQDPNSEDEEEESKEVPQRKSKYRKASSTPHMTASLERRDSLRQKSARSPTRLRPYLSRNSKQVDPPSDDSITEESDYKEVPPPTSAPVPKQRSRGRPRLVPQPPEGTSSNDSNHVPPAMSCKMHRRHPTEHLRFKGRIQTRNGGQRTVRYREQESGRESSMTSDSDDGANGKRYISISSRGRLRKLNRQAHRAMLYTC